MNPVAPVTSTRIVNPPVVLAHPAEPSVITET
jgi:hypothetical protein